jgi:hypothetical protein
LEILLAATTGGETVTTDCLVNVEEEAPVELLGKPRTPERNRFNEQKSYPARLGASARLADRLSDDRPLHLFKAGQHRWIGKRSRRKERAVEAPIWATRVRHNGKDRIAKRHIGRARCAQKCIRINVLDSAANGLL